MAEKEPKTMTAEERLALFDTHTKGLLDRAKKQPPPRPQKKRRH